MPVRAGLLYGVLLCMLPGTAFAYGAKVHAVVGHVAERYVCAAAAESMQELLPEGGLAEAGLWADRIRGNPAWDRAKPWHYINVPDGVRLSAAKRNPDGEALVCGPQRLTWRTFDERVNRVANALLARGIRKGDNIALWFPAANRSLGGT